MAVVYSQSAPAFQAFFLGIAGKVASDDIQQNNKMRIVVLATEFWVLNLVEGVFHENGASC